jgi:hypothetical protein
MPVVYAENEKLLYKNIRRGFVHPAPYFVERLFAGITAVKCG